MESWRDIQHILLPLTAILLARGFMHASMTAFLPTFIQLETSNLWLAGIALTVFEATGVVLELHHPDVDTDADRPRPGQVAGGAIARERAGRHVPAAPIHARPSAFRHPWRLHPEPEQRRLRVQVGRDHLSRRSREEEPDP